MSASEEQESLSADPEEHGSSGSAGDDQFGMLSGEGSEGDYYASYQPYSDYDEAEDEFGYTSDPGDIKSYESGEEADPYVSDYDEERDASLLSFASASKPASKPAASTRRRAPSQEAPEKPAQRRIVGSPKGKRQSRPLAPVMAVPRRETKTPTARPRTTEVSPLVYEFPGDPQDAAVMLESIEAVVEKYYPDEENNAAVSRCVLYSLMFHSFYPIEMQHKITRIINLLSD